MLGESSLTVVLQIAITQVASFASLLLLAAALHKLGNRARATRAVQALTGLPFALASPAMLGIAAAELLAAVGLWIAPLRFGAALLAALLWSGYFVFLVQAMAAGRSEVDCGCSFGTAHRPLGLFQVLRTGLLALLALVVAVSAAVAPGMMTYEPSAAAVATQLLAGGALLALYAALDQIMALQPLRAGVQA